MTKQHTLWLLSLLALIATLVLTLLTDPGRSLLYRSLLVIGPEKTRSWAVGGLVSLGEDSIPALWSALESLEESEALVEEIEQGLEFLRDPSARVAESDPRLGKASFRQNGS